MIVVSFETGEQRSFPCDPLTEAKFDGENLHRGIFVEMKIVNASFRSANLRNATFDRASMHGANFSNAALMNASFENADLQMCVFEGAVAAFADFSLTNLAGANFRDADVGGASFRKANLCGAYLVCRRIHEADFSDATYDASTVWPDGFDPLIPSHREKRCEPSQSDENCSSKPIDSE